MNPLLKIQALDCRWDTGSNSSFFLYNYRPLLFYRQRSFFLSINSEWVIYNTGIQFFYFGLAMTVAYLTTCLNRLCRL